MDFNNIDFGGVNSYTSTIAGIPTKYSLTIMIVIVFFGFLIWASRQYKNK